MTGGIHASGSRTTAADDATPFADDLATLVLGGATVLTADDHLRLVRRCATAEQVTRQLLQQSVDAARSAGQSWSAIGTELGMSRQAAHQRFGRTVAEPSSSQERWLGPVTAFDEMAELELAGRQGWHTVEAGLLRHRMVRTNTQWEHRRILWPRSTSSARRDGWQIGCRAFPWVYLVRDTGLPADDDAPDHATG